MRSFFLIFCFGLFAVAHAQKTVYFSLNASKNKIAASYYNSITVIDSRYDTVNAGFGFLYNNKRCVIVPDSSLSFQVKKVFISLVTGNSASEELLLQIRKFNFTGTLNPWLGAYIQTSYFAFKADAYIKQQDTYHLLRHIDTVVLIKHVDLEKTILGDSASNIVESFLVDVLSKQSAISNTTNTYEELVNINQLEKKLLPVYNTEVLKDGIYTTFNDFAMQHPSGKAAAVKDDGYGNVIDSASEETLTGRTLKKLHIKKQFAFVSNGIPYIITDFGVYRMLINNDNDFIFTGRMMVANKPDQKSTIAPALFLFVFGPGLLTGVMAAENNSINANGWYEVMLNANGDFVPLREIINKKTEPEL